MIKWVEVAKKNSRVRYDTLSRFLNDNGVNNAVEYVECEQDQFSEVIDECRLKYDLIRIGSPHGVSVFDKFDAQSSEMMRLRSADCAIKEKGRWRLMSSNYIGLRRILHEVGSGLDIESSILVVGAGAGARVACSAFISAGFKKVNITNKFPEQAFQLIEELQSIYFGITFEFIPEERLVLLPGTNNVLVNTTPLIPSNDLLNELYYFNFLKSPGMVFDFTLIPIDTPLVLEGDAIGVRSVRGFEVSSWGDIAWVESAFGKKLDREEYCESLKAAAAAVEFNLEPFR